MKCAILSIGSELMEGRIADTNAAWLSERLTELGFDVVRHVAVGDRRADILLTLRDLQDAVAVTIVTGGLGPTPDDPTREVFSTFCGVPLVERPEAARHIRELFARRGIVLPASNFVQALIPKGADYLHNPTGTAPGFALSHGGCRFFTLPGVPSEMKVMFNESVGPALRTLSDRVILIRSLHTLGMSEALIGERLAEMMAEGHSPAVATQASEGTITVRITASEADEATARKKLEAAEREIRARLGEVIFGADRQTLAGAVAELLEKRGLTLAVAESCTGGEIAARLTDVPGISRFFLEGVVTYSNASKVARLGVPEELLRKHGAVSAETAEAMATGVRRSSGADVALSATGIAGPTGGSEEKPVGLVFIGIADRAGARAERVMAFGTREQIKVRAAKRALNMLRLHLEKMGRSDG